MTKYKNESTILRYDTLVLKRRGLTRDLPSGTESLQWVTNTATLIYGEHDAIVVDTFASWKPPEGMNHDLLKISKYRVGERAMLCLWVNGQLNTAIRGPSRVIELQYRLKEWLADG